MAGTVSIYLADLGHNILTRSSDVYPLGVANIASYVSAHVTRAPLSVRIFREPQDLKAALDEQPPDLMGFSSYAWNERLSYHFAEYAKARSPQTLTVFGGPNWPLTEPVQEEFLRSQPAIDSYVDGPTYEGERAFARLVERYIDVGRRLEGVFDEPLPANTWIDRRTDAFVKGAPIDRITDLDEIPSPYLQGWMDPFYATGYFPLLQIARGCPFTCAFCNSGVTGNSRVYAHSIDNVKADLDHLIAHVAPNTTLCFADDNFGMYPRDEELADYMGWLQDRHGWPRYIRTTTGKNNGERIIRVMRKVKGALPMTSAVQSMNPVVLANIKRSNIKLDTYQQLQDELHRMGMQSYGELILCLPGETQQSILDAMERLLDAGAKRVSAHQLMLLHGAELSNPDSRERFGLVSRWRVVARNFGNYTGEPVIEVEEVVVETPTFSFEQYLETRVLHLLLTVFYYEGNFEEAFRFAAEHGVKAFRLLQAMQRLLPTAPEGLRALVDEFLRESQDELHPTREACVAWADAHYAGLLDGSIGGNLLSKYSMLGRFYRTDDCVTFLEAVVEDTLDADAPADQRDAVFGYLRAVLLGVPFRQSLLARVSWTTAFDVRGWARDGYAQRLAAYALPSSTVFTGAAPDDVRDEVIAKVDTFGEHPAGLGKFTRTMFARSLRRVLDDGTPSPSTPH